MANCFGVSLFILFYVESVEGFSVFKDSKSTADASVNEENHLSENDPSNEKKEFYRKLEVIIFSLLLHFFIL